MNGCAVISQLPWGTFLRSRVSVPVISHRGYNGGVVPNHWHRSPEIAREGDVTMPDDLLLKLETTAPVAGSLENIEDLVRVVTRELGLAVECMKGSALTFENGWRHIIMDVAKGQTTQIQAARPRLLSAF